MKRGRDGNGRRYALGLMIVLLAATLAGCIGDTGEDPDTLDAADEAADPPLEETTIPYESGGTFALGAGVCTAVGDVSLNACSSGNALVLDTEPAGTVQAAELELSWEAESPLMEELGLTFAWACGDDGCETEWATGSSPVEVTVDGIEEPGTVYVVVWTPDVGVSQAYVDYATPQDVTITGAFTSLVPTSTASGA